MSTASATPFTDTPAMSQNPSSGPPAGKDWWSQEDAELIRVKTERRGFTWERVSKRMKEKGFDRTSDECSTSWNGVQKARSRAESRGSFWLEEEDAELIRLRAVHPNYGGWPAISRDMKARVSCARMNTVENAGEA